MTKQSIARALVASTLVITGGHAASNMKFDSVAKYRLVTISGDKLVVEARIYGTNPGWAYSELVRMTPVEYLPFEYKGVVMTMSPEEALQMCAEVLNAPIFVKALEMMAKQGKTVDIGGHMAVIESTMQARMNKLTMLTWGSMFLSALTATFGLGQTLEKRFIPEWVKDMGGSRSWLMAYPLAGFLAYSSYLLHKLRAQTVANAEAMAHALLTYQNRTMGDAAITKSQAQHIANITRNVTIADMAEKLA